MFTLKTRPIHPSIISAFISIILFAASAAGQAPSAQSGATDEKNATIQDSQAVSAIKFETPEPKTSLLIKTKPTASTTPEADDVHDELAAVKAENAIVREQVRLLMEQQRKMLDQVSNLQRKVENQSKVDPQTGELVAGLPAAAARPGDSADPGVASVQDVPSKAPERYQDGIIIWKTPDEDKVPFLLKLNMVTQFRYLNTLNSDSSYTDHLGVEREVHTRNDVTVNRAMFTFTGYMWSKKLQYSFLVWTAAGAASIIVAGSIGYRFNRHITVTGGYLGIPGSRSLTNTFPYFASTDRTMADNFFRPGFTQGVMASGEITKGLYYNAFLGNSLNTLSITANKIDTNLMGAGSVWWEPFGAYGGGVGRSSQMYDDYFAQKKLRIRVGSSFTVPGKTVFQISTHPAQRTRESTILTA